MAKTVKSLQQLLDLNADRSGTSSSPLISKKPAPRIARRPKLAGLFEPVAASSSLKEELSEWQDGNLPASQSPPVADRVNEYFETSQDLDDAVDRVFFQVRQTSVLGLCLCFCRRSARLQAVLLRSRLDIP